MSANRPPRVSSGNIFIIGAARSGTKILRDLITDYVGIRKVPYDINYIWRLGNEQSCDDELESGQLTEGIKRRIQRQIHRYEGAGNHLIEKTVSNCLRVEFVNAVFPEAKFIHLVRRGDDVIESAYRQWMAPPDFQYIIKKGISFPPLDAFGYGISYAKKTLSRLMRDNAVSPGVWGPHYKGIEKDLEDKQLLEVCAIQWLNCVEKATRSLIAFEPDRVSWISYEDFVRNPERHLIRLADFIGVSPSPYNSGEIENLVDASNIGKGRLQLTPEQQELIQPYITLAAQLLSDPEVAQKLNNF